MYVSIYIYKESKEESTTIKHFHRTTFVNNRKKHTQKNDLEKFMTLIRSFHVQLGPKSRALSDVASYQWLEHKVIFFYIKGAPEKNLPSPTLEHDHRNKTFNF